MKNFFDYFPVSPLLRGWELCATSYGQICVPPHSHYPPTTHPDDHYFAWEQGRILQEYQLIYIKEGHGTFESAAGKAFKLGPGTVFLLFPGIWHRYRPDSATGWTESWIEFNGPYVAHLHQAGIMDPKNPVYRVDSVDEVEELLDKGQRMALEKPPTFSVQLALIALQILSLLRTNSAQSKPVPRRLERLISKSQTLLAENFREDFSVEKVARQLGIGYSYFRREFKRQTGFSPQQYRIEIRHRRAKDFLHSTSLSIKEISERLGYNSPYHLSLDFSKRTGKPPSVWRVEDRRGEG